MYHYVECGLEGVYLKNGYDVEDSPYGEVFSVHNIDKLHSSIGKALIESKSPLSASAFRFLREEMDLSQRAIAQMMGKSEQTVSLWERGRQVIPRSEDLIIRGLFQEHLEGSSHIRRLIDQIADDEREAIRLDMEETPQGEWGVAA